MIISQQLTRRSSWRWWTVNGRIWMRSVDVKDCGNILAIAFHVAGTSIQKEDLPLLVSVFPWLENIAIFPEMVRYPTCGRQTVTRRQHISRYRSSRGHKIRYVVIIGLCLNSSVAFVLESNFGRCTGWPKKLYIFQHTISLEPLKIKWKRFHRNVPSFSRNKDSVAIFVLLLNILCKLAQCSAEKWQLSVVLIEVFCYIFAKYEANFVIPFLLLLEKNSH